MKKNKKKYFLHFTLYTFAVTTMNVNTLDCKVRCKVLYTYFTLFRRFLLKNVSCRDYQIVTIF